MTHELPTAEAFTQWKTRTYVLARQASPTTYFLFDTVADVLAHPSTQVDHEALERLAAATKQNNYNRNH